MNAAEQHSTSIKVRVSFPVSRKGPFSESYPPETTVATIRDAAMVHFVVSDDAQFAYVLSNDGKRQEPGTALREIAGDEGKVEFGLIKVITQGNG